jgi:hypothetical protein
MILSGILITLPLLGTPPLLAGETAESVYRTYDLAAHGGQATRHENSNYLFPASVFYSEMADYERNEWTFDPDMIVDVLHAAIEDELEYEGRHYGVTEQQEFCLYAPESVHQRVRQVLGVFASASRVDANLQVDVFTVPAGTNSLPAGILSLKDAKKCLEIFGDQLTESYTVPMHVDLPSILNAAKRQECLLDYDVEVAHDSMCFDPRMVTMLSGTRLRVAATPSAEGCDLALIYWNGEPAREVESHSFDTRGVTHSEQGRDNYRGPDVIQSISTQQRTLALNTAIPRDRAVVLSLGMNVSGGQSEQRVMLRMTGDLQPMLRSTDLGSGQKIHLLRKKFASPALVKIEGGAHGLSGSVGRIQDKLQEYNMEFMAQFDNEGSDFGIDLVQSALDDTEFNVTNEWMLCLERESNGDSVKETLTTMVGAIARPSELMQASLELQRPGGETLLTYAMPLRIGAESAVVLGVESSGVRDYDVEIAQGSSVSDPIGVINLDGAVCLLHPTRTTDGRTQLRVQLTAQVVDETQHVMSEDSSFGRIDQASYSHLVFDQIVPFDGSGTRTVQLGNSSGAGDGLSLKVTIGDANLRKFNFNISTR